MSTEPAAQSLDIEWRSPSTADLYRPYLVSVEMHDGCPNDFVVGEASLQDDGQWWWANSYGEYHGEAIVPGPYAIADLPAPAPRRLFPVDTDNA